MLLDASTLFNCLPFNRTINGHIVCGWLFILDYYSNDINNNNNYIKRTNSEYKTLQHGNLSWYRVCDCDQSPFRILGKWNRKRRREKKTNQAIHSTTKLVSVIQIENNLPYTRATLVHHSHSSNMLDIEFIWDYFGGTEYTTLQHTHTQIHTPFRLYLDGNGRKINEKQLQIIFVPLCRVCWTLYCQADATIMNATNKNTKPILQTFQKVTGQKPNHIHTHKPMINFRFAWHGRESQSFQSQNRWQSAFYSFQFLFINRNLNHLTWQQRKLPKKEKGYTGTV